MAAIPMCLTKLIYKSIFMDTDVLECEKLDHWTHKLPRNAPISFNANKWLTCYLVRHGTN